MCFLLRSIVTCVLFISKSLRAQNKYQFFKGHVGNTHKNLLSSAALVDAGPNTKSHSRKINRTCGIQVTGRCQHIRRVRGTWKMDFLPTLAACDGPESPELRYQAAKRCLRRWFEGLNTMWRQQVVWMSVSATQWHENRNSEVKRFNLMRNVRRRLSGTSKLDRHHWNVKRSAEHTYRAWCRACIAGRRRADPNAMRNESEKYLLVFRVDYGNLWDRAAARWCRCESRRR